MCFSFGALRERKKLQRGGMANRSNREDAFGQCRYRPVLIGLILIFRERDEDIRVRVPRAFSRGNQRTRPFRGYNPIILKNFKRAGASFLRFSLLSTFRIFLNRQNGRVSVISCSIPVKERSNEIRIFPRLVAIHD